MSLETIMGSLAKTAASEIAKKTISSVIESLAQKHKVVEIIKFKENYLEYCEKVLKIKTLVSQDKSYHIDEIFVPIHIIQSGSSTSFEINHKTTLDNDRALLIKGLAGQGKSTLLKKFLSNNSKQLSRLPIFYELKNYQGGDIEDSIAKSLQNSGVNISNHSTKKLLSDSNVKVYLDAFDEVNPKFRSDLLEQIRRLANGFHCHIIVTSRPDTEIDTLSEFMTYTVCELSENQIFGIIRKTASDEDKSTELCEALERSPLHRRNDSILKSPILVVLFCISYNLGEDIPSTLSQFYLNIFDTVFHRHDNIKGKVYRKRYFNDNRSIYKELFNCLCFASLRKGLNSFNREKLIEFIGVSLQHVNQDKSLSDTVANEIVMITNLIIEDGFNDYRYVHKSIQEFFSASFIQSLSHERKIAFYSKCFSDYDYHSIFQNTLFFLEEVDFYDYYEYGFIPSVCKMFNLERKDLPDEIKIKSSLIDLFLDKSSVYSRINLFKGKRGNSYELELRKLSFESTDKYPEIYSRIFNFAADHINLDTSEDNIKKLMLEKGELKENGWHRLSLRSLLEAGSVDLSKVNTAILLSFDVLIRRKFKNAIRKISSRSESLRNEDYFDF